MLRRIIAVLIVLIVAVWLSACGGGDAHPTAELVAEAEATPAVEASEATPAAEANRPYAFRHAGFELVAGTAMSEALERIGEPTKLFEAPSCAFEGVDRIYYYPSFLITTYPEGGVDKILAITLIDDGARAEGGAEIGMTAAEVEARCGEGEWNEYGNQLSYDSGGVRLAFLFEDGILVDATYSCIEAMRIAGAAR